MVFRDEFLGTVDVTRHGASIDIPNPGGGQVRIQADVYCSPWCQIRVWVTGESPPFDRTSASGWGLLETILPFGPITVHADILGSGHGHLGWVQIWILHPNLRAHAPEVDVGGRWVGYGYHVDDRPWNPLGEHIVAALAYSNGKEVVGLANYRGQGDRVYLAQHGLTLSANSAGVPRDNPEFRVAFDAMPVPPPEATHLMTLVDVDEDGTSRIIESNEEDNRAYLPLPTWPTLLEWKIGRDLRADITTYGNDGHDAGRNVYPFRMTIKVQEQVWGRWIPARECCHLRVSNQAVAAKQRNNQSYKGWLFQTRFGDTIAARKSIANGFTDAELPVPMNGFDQKKRPAGAGKDSKYLHVPLQDIDLVNSEVSFLYLPPTVEGEDVITVELYRNGMNGQPPQLLQVTTNRVKIVAEYTIEWVQGPEEVAVSVFQHPSRPVASQLPRMVRAETIKLKAMVNGRPVSSDFVMHVEVQGRQPGDAKGSKRRWPGWLLPERLGKSLGLDAEGNVTKAVSISKNKKLGLPAINEVKWLGINAPLEKNMTRVFDFPIGKRGIAEFLYMPPMAGGEDEFKVRVARPSQKTRGDETDPSIVPHKPLRKTVRLKPIWLPCFFVPGIMASRIRMNDPASILGPHVSWRPDASGYMGRNWVIGTVTTDQIRRRLADAERATVLTDLDDVGNSHLTPQQLSDRGSGQVFWGAQENNVPTTGYWPLLEMDWLPADGFVDLDIHAVGYDWRRDNGVEANDIANVIRQGFEQMKSRAASRGSDVRSDRMAFVTHSMGGLLTRALLRTHADLAAKTIAAVHVFQPATGAPVFYTRFHTGTVVHAGILEEEFVGERAFSLIAGDTGPEFAATVSGLRSAFQLMPTTNYRTGDGGWLNDTRRGVRYEGPSILDQFRQEGVLLLRRPIEIYLGTVVDPIPPDPSLPPIQEGGLSPRQIWELRKPRAEELWQETKRSFDAAVKFHEGLGTWVLPERTWSIAGGGVDTVVGATIAEHEGRAIIAEVAGIGDGTVPLASARALIPAAMTARSVEVPPSETTRQWIVQGLNHDNPFGGNTRPVLSILAEILRHVTHGPPPKSRK